MRNVLFEQYGQEKRWVNWQLKDVKGKKTKVPYSPVNGKPASSTDSKTWTTHEMAADKSPNVGIVFTPAQDLLGIDIDHCIEGSEIRHAERANIRKLIKAADTYTELSPSGEGLHLYLALSAPLPLVANKKAPYEAYTSGRYFTNTAIPFGVAKDVRTVTPQEALELLKLIGYPWGKGESETQEASASRPKEKKDTAVSFDDKELLERIFTSKNGFEIEQLYKGDISAYKKDASSADMALLSHLAFWSGKNSEQMERVWMHSPLGSREKTQKRQDYRTRSIKAAISHCKEVYKPQDGASSMKPGDSKLDLLYSMNPQDKSKTYIQNTENMCRILRHHPEFEQTFRYDVYRTIMERKVDGAWRPLEDSDAVEVQTKISILFAAFRKVGKDMCYDAIIKVSKENAYDSAADYVRGLVWDKKARLDTWLSIVYGTPDDQLHAAIGSNFLKGLVDRIIRPGCKFDYVLVLEGEQGIRKSTSLAILAGELGHVETTMSTETKDFFMQFIGNAIVEFSEGETLSRTETKRLKAIITVQNDKYRAPYGRVSTNNPRRCVFAMTTNQTEYLKDETGNRRWLPVAVTKVADTDWLLENRDQLFAEAYHRVANLKETTYEFPDEDMLRAQNDRRIHDPNSEGVVDWYVNQLTPTQREDGITVAQAFVHALNNGFQTKMSRYEEMTVADILKTVLLLNKKQVMLNGVRASRWLATDKTPTKEMFNEAVPSTLEL